MNRYKLTFRYTDNTFTYVLYESSKNYEDAFKEMQENINNHNWFSFGDDEKKYSTNTSNVKYWSLETRSSYNDL